MHADAIKRMERVFNICNELDDRSFRDAAAGVGIIDSFVWGLQERNRVQYVEERDQDVTDELRCIINDSTGFDYICMSIRLKLEGIFYPNVINTPFLG